MFSSFPCCQTRPASLRCGAFPPPGPAPAAPGRTRVPARPAGPAAFPAASTSRCRRGRSVALGPFADPPTAASFPAGSLRAARARATRRPLSPRGARMSPPPAASSGQQGLPGQRFHRDEARPAFALTDHALDGERTHSAAPRPEAPPDPAECRPCARAAPRSGPRVSSGLRAGPWSHSWADAHGCSNACGKPAPGGLGLRGAAGGPARGAGGRGAVSRPARARGGSARTRPSRAALTKRKTSSIPLFLTVLSGMC